MIMLGRLLRQWSMRRPVLVAALVGLVLLALSLFNGGAQPALAVAPSDAGSLGRSRI